MKKKLIALVLMLALVLTFGLVACNEAPAETGHEATVTYGEVGMDKHNYFPYATVTVAANGDIKEIEIGEAFGPSGKMFTEQTVASGTGVETIAVTYNNPWYPKFKADIQDPVAAATGTTAALRLAAKKAAANGHYISIDGKVFEATVGRVDYGNIRLAEGIYFENATDGIKLTDDYLAQNMGWYVAAIKADKVFACTAEGVRITGDDGKFMNTSLLKNDDALTYGHNFDGGNFTAGMKILEDLAKETKFVGVELAKVTSGGNHEGLRIKDLDMTEGAVVAGATATHFQYHVSYWRVAEKAYQMAVAASRA